MQKRLENIVAKLSNSTEIIVATDYDREGQLIAYNLLKESNIDSSDVRRMKFSIILIECDRTFCWVLSINSGREKVLSNTGRMEEK